MADRPLADTDEMVITNGNDPYELKVNQDGSINVFTGSVGTGVLHKNGTATTAPSTITFGVTSVSFLIHNVGNQPLYTSFDGGVLYKIIGTNSMLAMDVRIASVVVKTNAATTTYETLVVY